MNKYVLLGFAALVFVSAGYDITAGETAMRGGAITKDDDPIFYWGFVAARIAFVYWALHQVFVRRGE